MTLEQTIELCQVLNTGANDMTENEKILLAALETAMGALADWRAEESTRQIVMSAAWSEAQKAIRTIKASQNKD